MLARTPSKYHKPCEGLASQGYINTTMPSNTPSIIAIDGPAASGKSTLGLKLAQALDYLFFDTGVMYRASYLAGAGTWH